jgi:chromosome partitioning protein
MQTVAVTINKGGVGKTTITKNLATAAAAAGLTVLIIDMDTQQNADAWGKRRKQHQPDRQLPLVQFTTERDLPEVMERARAAECDLVLIDTPPGRSTEAPAAVEAADFVLIPFWLETDAFEGLKKTGDLARRLGTPAAAVLNFATPNSRSHEESARDVLKALDVRMSPVVLHRYEAHRNANPTGLTAYEAEPDSRAAAEIAALWEWLRAELQIGTSAHVHKGAA